MPIGDARAFRRAIFESGMLRAVDLDQLTQAVATITRLIGAFEALTAGYPEVRLDHPRADGLHRQVDAVAFIEFFRRQRGTEVRIAGPQEIERTLAHRDGQLVVTGVPTPARDQTGCTVGPVRPDQALHLPQTEF